MVSEQIIYAFSWASWSGIFAGAVAAIAISIIMATFGVALGMSVIKPKSDDPAEHLGVAFGGWSFVSMVVSMAFGGFIAGLFSGQRGLEHGFLVWAVVAIVGTCLSGMAIGNAFRAIGTAVKSVGSGAAHAASTLGKGASNAMGSMIDQLRANVDLNVDSDKLTDNIRNTLRDTGVETLQPEYLEQQMREARSDLRNSLHQLTLKPSESEKIIADFLQKEKGRLDSLTKGVNRDAAVKAIMEKRGIPQEEAQTMVDNAISAYDHAVGKAKEALAEARTQVEEAKVQLKEMADHARAKADEFASKAAKAALAAGIAMIVAAVISMGAGACGARYATSWYAVAGSYTVR